MMASIPEAIWPWLPNLNYLEMHWTAREKRVPCQDLSRQTSSKWVECLALANSGSITSSQIKNYKIRSLPVKLFVTWSCSNAFSLPVSTMISSSINKPSCSKKVSRRLGLVMWEALAVWVRIQVATMKRVSRVSLLAIKIRLRRAVVHQAWITQPPTSCKTQWSFSTRCHHLRLEFWVVVILAPWSWQSF